MTLVITFSVCPGLNYCSFIHTLFGLWPMQLNELELIDLLHRFFWFWSHRFVFRHVNYQNYWQDWFNSYFAWMCQQFEWDWVRRDVLLSTFCGQSLHVRSKMKCDWINYSTPIAIQDYWQNSQTLLHLARHNKKVVSPNRIQFKMQFLMSSTVSNWFNPFMASIFSTPFCCYDLAAFLSNLSQFLMSSGLQVRNILGFAYCNCCLQFLQRFSMGFKLGDCDSHSSRTSSAAKPLWN